MQDLTQRHLHSVTQAYQYAPIYAHAMKHLRDVRSLDDSALGTKRTYHSILSTHIRDRIHITHTHHMWRQHVCETAEAYYTAKRMTYTLYT